MAQTEWWIYVQRLIGSDSAQDAARRAGFDKSAFTRWKKGANADPEVAVKLARAYGGNVLEALVAGSLITAAEAALREATPPAHEVLQSVSAGALAEEVLRRMGDPSPLMTCDRKGGR
ncbi:MULTISPECIES: helix-turn-helix domain-containing protein [Mycolicibacter]|uniref:Helix-turn-helix transcriptional regulator n=2 Tax=Mycolicibacter TaxID=1073531 RepID=A0ABU5XMN0_9MYCO|nr:MULTISPECIES: helix-turn-helix transcriptional regulator [unclassified Mycolicibacter]MEB3023443.1 helix-turn-helix transcriptional regulator [Mycolicibacter sp. MYC098]MEB3033785.1 helix-turn-helix transcriptional regulator [Mycolicibacter sp. MYC340]